MTVTAEEFRAVLGHLAGGVTIVTAQDSAGAPRGLTATAVTSVSLAPPMILVCVGSAAETNSAISSSGSFAVHFLHANDRALADRFASDSGTKFEGLNLRSDSAGAPVLEQAMAWCEATVVHEVPAGDHTVFIGRVERVAVGQSSPTKPLVHYRGRYAELTDPDVDGEE